MKIRIDARVEPDLLRDVGTAVSEDQTTLTRAIEDGLRLWLKSRRRRKKAEPAQG